MKGNINCKNFASKVFSSLKNKSINKTEKIPIQNADILFNSYSETKKKLTEAKATQSDFNRLYKNYLAALGKLPPTKNKKTAPKNIEQVINLNLVKEAFSHYYNFDTGVNSHFLPWEPTLSTFEDRLDEQIKLKTAHTEEKIANIYLSKNTNIEKAFSNHYDLNSSSINEYDNEVLATDLIEISKLDQLSKIYDDFGIPVDLEDTSILEFKEPLVIENEHELVKYDINKSEGDKDLVKNRSI